MQRRKLTFSRRARVLGALLALILLLSSCIRYEAVITIDDDGSGTVDLLTAIDPSAFAAFGAPEDDAAICDDFSSDMTPGEIPAGASVEPYNEDGLCGARVQYALTASEDHSSELAEVLDESTRIYKQGENWFFESNFSAEEVTGEASEFGGDEIVNDLFGDASFVITVDLPGRAVAGENNATNVGDDGRFTWDIDLLNPPTSLFAQTEPGSGGGTGGGDGGGISPILIGVIVVALLAAVGAFLYLRNRGSGSDTASVGGPAPQPLGDTMPQPMPAPGTSPPMPVGDGPAIDATPPPSAPVRPADPGSIKETVVMNPSAMGGAADSSIPTPEYDEALGAWVVDDPARGRLRHDPDTDSWIPV